MTQCQLDRAIAAATGESVDLIRHRGFSLAMPDRPARRHRHPRRRTRKHAPSDTFHGARATPHLPAA